MSLSKFSLCHLPFKVVERTLQFLIDQEDHRAYFQRDQHLVPTSGGPMSPGLRDILNLRATCRYFNELVKISALLFKFDQSHDQLLDKRPNFAKFFNMLNEEFSWKCEHLCMTIFAFDFEDRNKKIHEFVEDTSTIYNNLFGEALKYFNVSLYSEHASVSYSNKHAWIEFCAIIPKMVHLFSIETRVDLSIGNFYQVAFNYTIPLEIGKLIRKIDIDDTFRKDGYLRFSYFLEMFPNIRELWIDNLELHRFRPYQLRYVLEFIT